MEETHTKLSKARTDEHKQKDENTAALKKIQELQAENRSLSTDKERLMAEIESLGIQRAAVMEEKAALQSLLDKCLEREVCLRDV